MIDYDVASVLIPGLNTRDAYAFDRESLDFVNVVTKEYKGKPTKWTKSWNQTTAA